jgi:hypothetical protein
MSCDRCVDVHNAQAAGLSGKSCECSCHGYSWTYPLWTGTGLEDITVTSTLTCTGNCDDLSCSGGKCHTLNLNNE